MNVCEMLWGSSLYVDLYDKPDLVRDFLSLITETYIRFMRRWDEMIVDSHQLTDRSELRTDNCELSTSYAVHWSMLHRGRIMVRE